MVDKMFSDMADQFTENGTIFYPNGMELLYCAFDRDLGEVPDYTHYTTIFKSRTESLKKHWSWKIMEDGGYYRRLGR
ncbi:hypothetical protein CPC08DRAFT_763283 [Agrocybe pediades]|nr:hypothetical protein CPC08DRAFT_763283 [Agrocybe pediades]